MSVARTTTRTRPNTVGWIAIIIFAFLAGLGTIAALAAVGAVQLGQRGAQAALRR